MTGVTDRQAQRLVEVALMGERGQRIADFGDHARALGIVEPRAGRKIVQDRRRRTERADHPRQAQIERAEVDQHDQIARVRTQRGGGAQTRWRAACGIFPSASNGPSDAQPALRCAEPDAGALEPLAADPVGIDVGAARAHRAEQVGGQQFARRFTRAYEHAQRRGRHFKMPRSDGASRNASSWRPSSVLISARSASIAWRMLLPER